VTHNAGGLVSYAGLKSVFYQMVNEFGTIIRFVVVNKMNNQLKSNIMKLKKENSAIKALSVEATVKTKASSSIYSLALLIFSMIGVSTVLQLVYLA